MYLIILIISYGIADSCGDNATPYMELKDDVTLNELWQYIQINFINK